MVDKSRQNEAFYQLDKAKQNAIILLFEDELSDEQIAKSVNRSRATLSKWKNDDKFKQAQIEYRRVVIDGYVPDAIKRLHKLATGAKSEMVSLQAAQSILSMAGFGTTDSSPELEQAKIEKAKTDVRKAKAEADIKEAEAKAAKDMDAGQLTINITPFGGDTNGN
ncbi:phBC6A51 family helix-turn-helix protein [Latilactobacillus fragifolii]|uniref:phBC6A51 family helix-turn-helix protein n=1 Tax=Latilactobacillus fragifolii TaxID=2814244 RepID=UPI001ABA0B13|nr:helix-turn-helix domain-containing protein [Latilactobacillus fragifolii]